MKRIHARVAASLSAIGLVAALAACSDSFNAPLEEPTPISVSLTKIGTFEGGALGAAEITAYDSGSRRLFVVNGANGTVDVLDIANLAAPTRVGVINVSAIGAAVNSVAVNDGLVALAIEANPKTNPGVVAFYNASDLRFLHSVPVGALPDMLTFTPDGRFVLVANEGEPNSYGLPTSLDPEGSVSVITVNRTGISTVATADFRAFNGQETQLRAQGIRIYGPNASAAQDLEPEYIAVSDDGRTAYVTLQENNAIAIVDIATARVTSLRPLGFKDHNLPNMGMDPSDEDGTANSNSGVPAINIRNVPVRGMYMPDAIAFARINNTNYLLTANEGDARADWPGFNEETRVRQHCTNGLDPSVFPDATNLLFDSNLGRLRITTTPNGGRDGKNALGQCNELWSFGARSFSIWNTEITRVYDSGDDLERRTTNLANVNFNASHDNNTLDSRSPSKGPEPEGVVVAKFGKKTFAFIGLERVGGLMVYDVSNPAAVVFVSYLNTREGVTGDRGAEGLTFIPANRSPNGQPLIVVGNEVSGTTAIYRVNLNY
ncbi:MAG: choice-of-anchor I family protein [Burkholderiales bacterium]|nr:choice-of-anchor I family protein [Nitrosomonadaceae bacterium]